jgi:gliding motility-associated-like protein
MKFWSCLLTIFMTSALWGQMGVFGSVGHFEKEVVSSFGSHFVFHEGVWGTPTFPKATLFLDTHTSLETGSDRAYFDTALEGLWSGQTVFPFGYQDRQVLLYADSKDAELLNIRLTPESVSSLGFYRVLDASLPFVWEVSGNKTASFALPETELLKWFSNSEDCTWVGFSSKGWQAIASQQRGVFFTFLEARSLALFSKIGIVKLLPQNPIAVAEAITPNGDGINDSWHIKNIEAYPTAHIQVFNRRGILVFDAPAGYDQTWEGRDPETQEILPAGSYYYQIRLYGTYKNSSVQRGILLIKGQ